MKNAPERAAVVVMFLRIASGWALSDRDAGTLLGVDAATVQKWRQRAPRLCTAACETRAWLLLEIAARGQQYFGATSKWLTAARPDLGKTSLLGIMLRGSEADLTRALTWLCDFPETLRHRHSPTVPDRQR